MSHPVIEFENVFFSYGEDAILSDMNLQVAAKEFIGIIGPNGGGKTTMLKLIMGFLHPQRGVIKVLGKPPGEKLTRLAYVPQGLRFDRQFPISVMELVLSGRLSRLPWYGTYSKDDEKAACDALEMVGMLSHRDSPFGTLSGGQAQRALIARAIVSSPEILLLDEPTASVDAQAEADIYKLLVELHKQMTILMVTHDLSAAINIVERVLCVQKTVISLPPQEVCEHFAIGLYHAPLQVGQGRKS